MPSAFTSGILYLTLIPFSMARKDCEECSCAPDGFIALRLLSESLPAVNSFRSGVLL